MSYREARFDMIFVPFSPFLSFILALCMLRVYVCMYVCMYLRINLPVYL